MTQRYAMIAKGRVVRVSSQKPHPSAVPVKYPSVEADRLSNVIRQADPRDWKVHDGAVEVVYDIREKNLGAEKSALKGRVEQWFQESVDFVDEKYPRGERETWWLQLRELEDYEGVASRAAKARGVTRERVVDEVKAKIQDFEETMGIAIGQKQKLFDLIDAAEDFEALRDVRATMGRMPVPHERQVVRG